MSRISAALGQALFYAAFMAGVGYFATAPAYSPIAPGQAVIKLSFSHYGQPVSECRKRSAEELAQLPPNMRSPMDCTRERSPVEVELELDGELVYDESLRPTGLSRDGPTYVYERFQVPVGRHRLRARLKDDVNLDGFNYQSTRTIELGPAEIQVVEFKPARGGFLFD